MSIVITALVVLLAAVGAAALAVAVLHVTSRWQPRRQQAAGRGVKTAIQRPDALVSVSVAGLIPLQSRVGPDDFDPHASPRPRWAAPLTESDSA
jgi:hypothetical protein